MRDEVLVEWRQDEEKYSLDFYLHVSGGLIFDRVAWRETIFRSDLQLVLESIRYGDRQLFIVNPELDHALIYVYFQSPNPKHHKT